MSVLVRYSTRKKTTVNQRIQNDAWQARRLHRLALEKARQDARPRLVKSRKP